MLHQEHHKKKSRLSSSWIVAPEKEMNLILEATASMRALHGINLHISFQQIGFSWKAKLKNFNLSWVTTLPQEQSPLWSSSLAIFQKPISRFRTKSSIFCSHPYQFIINLIRDLMYSEDFVCYFIIEQKVEPLYIPTSIGPLKGINHPKPKYFCILISNRPIIWIIRNPRIFSESRLPIR